MFWLHYPWHQPHQIPICPYHAIRSSGTGGGIGLLYRKDLKIEQLETVFKSFEFKELYSSASIIRITRSSASIIHIVFICRQPISARNGLTYALFFDEFSTLLEPLVSAFGKLLLAGDLNFHVNNPSEANAYQFLDVLSCFNLNASNVNIPIHKSINLLDLIITRSGEDTSFNLSVNDPGYLETLCCPLYFRLWKAIEQESSSCVKETEQHEY